MLTIISTENQLYLQATLHDPDINDIANLLPDRDSVHNTPFTQFNNYLTRFKNLSKHSNVWKDSLCRDLNCDILHELCLTA